ncbi:hypothetical protein [Sandaracinus amylolyticus]|uniref:hypothetical protein n=1 Tax=Sandaracinus amylolyticus TaxID=927083 RepID=UPI001F3BFC61|nr:hypothetical protein [Sandaracinus amylolyticus]
MDDDVTRLRAVSDALRARGHDVLAFPGVAEARAGLRDVMIDVVVATAAIASTLDETRHERTRNASWVLRGKAEPRLGPKFIASVAIDASPHAVAETVAAALMMRRPKLPRPPSAIVAAPPPRIVPVRLPEPALAVAAPLPSATDAPALPTAPSDEHARTAALDAPEPAATPPVSAPRRVGVVARDAKMVRRLCETLDAAGMSTRGFTAARTAREVAMAVGFDALVLEEQLDGLDAVTVAARLALDLGARAPRIVVLARPESVLTEGAVHTIVRSPTTPEAILRAVVGTMDARELPAPT